MGNTEPLRAKRASAFESLCRFYVVTCGLPAIVRPDLARIVLPAGSVGAVTMRAHIGAQVRVHMEARPNGRVGPIVSHPRSKRWTFLVCPDLPGDIVLWAELLRHNVSIAPIGAEVALPSPFGSVLGYREWVCEPRDGFRPPGTEIVDAVRCCVPPLRR